MARKLFDKEQPRKCEYCLYGRPSETSQDVYCEKRGVVKKNDLCRKYRYDALKRTPNVQKITGDFTPEDFSIN